MTPAQASRARADLHSINLQASRMPHYNGQLTPRGLQVINARLDEVAGRIRATRQDARNY